MKNIRCRRRCRILAATLSASFAVAVYTQDLCKPVGWATQNGGVTGGGSATPVTVSSYNDLKSALTSGTAKVIHLSGTISVPSGGIITVQDRSGKTVAGLPGSKMVSTDVTAGGSGILYVKRCTNFILRNLVFEGPGAHDVDGNDNLCLDNSQNVWVDHCEFHDGVDGNFDIKNMSDFISVTWCTFSYEKPPRSGGSGGSDDHRYSNLIGSSDNATDDDGHLNVTFQYCWWGAGCRERMPRMRFGKLHMVNNLFSSSVANHCIRAGYKANVLATGNYFDKQKLPIDEYDGDYTAIRAYNNYGLSDITKKSAFTPPYSIEIADPLLIVNQIKSCAGAKLTGADGCSSCGEPVNKGPTVSLTAPGNSAVFDAPATIALTATATDDDGTVAMVEFYNGTTLLGTDATSPYNYSWTDVAPGSYTITAKATDNNGITAISAPVSVIVSDPSLPSLAATASRIQTVDSGAAITPIVFTWGGAATDVNCTALPGGLTASKDTTAKTLSISGIPSAGGSFTVSTAGGKPAVTIEAAVSIKTPGRLLADWYPFREDSVSLGFVSFANASVDTGFYDRSKPDNGVPYSPGALRLAKENGSMTIALHSLETLKIRWYATGKRTLKVIYSTGGTEKTWSSSSPYESGAHESDLTAMIPGLVSGSPATITLINDRTDGGSLYLHDLYIEGTELSTISTGSSTGKRIRKESIALAVTGNTLTLYHENRPPVIVPYPVFILDMQGKTVMTPAGSSAIDITGLSKGVYFLRIGRYRGKFIRY